MKPFYQSLLTASAFTLLFSSSLDAADIYVSPTGNDSSSGKSSAPLKTLSAARDAVRQTAGKEKTTIHMADGVYYLPETLVFTPSDSGSAQHPVIYQAVNEGKAVLSGGSKLDLKWTDYRDGILKATTPSGLKIDQLFINGKSQRMARYPNYDASKKTAAYQGFAADAFSKERAAKWSDPEGGYIHAMHRARWGGYHYRITGKKADGNVSYEGGWQNNRQMGMHAQFRMVENIFEELDAPGEWFHNAKTNTLYYKPEQGVDLKTAAVEVVRLRHLVEFQGSESKPVHHITLQGFVVRHAARTFMDTKEPLLRSDWAIYRGGAFMLTGTEDVSILDTEFDQVGGNAIFVNNYSRRVLVKGCHIHDVGASGVCFVGDPDAVRNPLFEYGQRNDLTKIDRTPGPKTNNYPADGVVEDCLIHGIGRVERQPAGVQIEMAMKITVRDTSIYDCSRSGINIGDGCWGGHLIDRCDVFDTVLETHDHGSFNSWGRDRFWVSNRSVSQKAIDKDPNLPFLDAIHTTVIRNSRWRCDHGWDIDLDDGSGNYELYNNLLLNGGLKFREGFRRRAWNNITVNNGFHPHVWYNNSGDELFSNILMRKHAGIGAPTKMAFGKRIDSNLYFSSDPQMQKRYASFGWDKTSITADPLFVDPEKGDFSVRKQSPAFTIGFKNFPMDQFGVKKASLKAIAKTPIIPTVNSSAPAGKPSRQPSIAVQYWLGAKLHELKGEEFSAYGVSKEENGVALIVVPKNSAAAHAGLKSNDLIQSINGHKVTGLTQLFKALVQIGNAPIKATIVRNQKKSVMMLSNTPFTAVESADIADGFSKLKLPESSTGKMTAQPRTNNDPVACLVDGKLAKSYGPVFSNGVGNGMYKLDLGQKKSIQAITAWSYHQNKSRGAQKWTAYGSDSASDPGWDVKNAKRFTVIGSIDTTGGEQKAFNAASLRSGKGTSQGSFRWIIWQVTPVTKGGENTAFQELQVQVKP